MNVSYAKKIIAVSSITLLFLNMLFLALKLYHPLTFWIILGVIAVTSLAAMRILKK
jgi:hypothetical protein